MKGGGVCEVTHVTWIISDILSSSFWLSLSGFINGRIGELASAAELMEIFKGLDSLLQQDLAYQPLQMQLLQGIILPLASLAYVVLE